MIDDVKRKLLIKYPFFGSVIANVSFNSDNNIKTAGTDGKVIHYNPEFVDSLDMDHKIFLFSHEVCHIAFNHIERSKGKDKRIWNMATDAVINQFLQLDGLKVLDGAFMLHDAILYDAEELYQMLFNKYKDSNQNSYNDSKNNQGSSDLDSDNSNNNDNNDNLDDVGHDTHNMWGAKKSDVDIRDSDALTKDANLEKEVKKISELGEEEAFRENNKKRRVMLNNFRDSLVSISLGHGNNTNSDKIDLDSIGINKPIIDWRRVLRETINYNVDFSYQNAFIDDGVVVVPLDEVPTPVSEIVLDTSGSIDRELLKSFLRECKNILLTSKVRVGCFDTMFYGFHEIRSFKDIETLEFRGGGGTDFNVAVDAFSKRVDNRIIFTDGKCDMPKKALDAIWVVVGSHTINPRGGKVINVSRDDLKVFRK